MPKKNKTTYLTPNEAADYVSERSGGVISVTPTCVRIWANESDIGIKFAGRWKIDRDKLDKFLQLETFSETEKK